MGSMADIGKVGQFALRRSADILDCRFADFPVGCAAPRPFALRQASETAAQQPPIGGIHTQASYNLRGVRGSDRRADETSAFPVLRTATSNRFCGMSVIWTYHSPA